MITALPLVFQLGAGSLGAAPEGAGSLGPTPDAEATTEDPWGVYETTLSAGIGGLGGPTVAGLALEASATHRLSVLEAGGDLYTGGFFASMTSVSALFGFHFDYRVRVSVLGAVGQHHYHAVGSGLLTDDPGADGTLPFVGARLVLNLPFGRQSQWSVVLAGFLDEDLGRSTRHYTYVHHDWLFGNDSSAVSTSRELGQRTFGGTLGLAVGFDLTSY